MVLNVNSSTRCIGIPMVGTQVHDTLLLITLPLECIFLILHKGQDLFISRLKNTCNFKGLVKKYWGEGWPGADKSHQFLSKGWIINFSATCTHMGGSSCFLTGTGTYLMQSKSEVTPSSSKG